MKNKPVSRRDFIISIAAASTGFFACGARSRKAGKGFLSNIGVCTSIQNHELAHNAGCTYIEDGVRRFLIPGKTGTEFGQNLAVLKEAKLPVRACNSFLPGNLKSVGLETKHEEILKFADTAFRRAKQSGVRVVVFGSGGSRKIPDGFDPAEAEKQFIELLNKMSPIAGKYDTLIALEPLNAGETNLMNSVTAGKDIVEAVSHPNCRLLADIYHMMRENEGPEAILDAGEYLVHTHIAEKENRTPPGVKGDDFRPYLDALRKVNYKGRMSIECRWENFAEQLAPAVAALKKQIGDVG